MEDRHSGEGSEDMQNLNNANNTNQDGTMPQQHQDRFHRNQGTILFVGNLPFQTPWQHVKDHFRQAGNVRYTDLIADRSGRPKGSALVTMMNPEGAESAIRMFNETDFEGRRLIVRKFDDGPRPPLVQRDMMPSYSSAGAQRRAMYAPGAGAGMAGGAVGAGGMVGGYYRGAVAGGAPGAAGPAGGFVRAAGAMGGVYGANGAAGGVGVSPYQVGAEMIDMDGENVPKPRSQQVPEAGRKLFVSNLPFDCTSGALRETFQQVGNVERAEIILGRSGKSRGMGIVVMKSEDEARVAIAEFDGIEMAGRAMNVRLDNRS